MQRNRQYDAAIKAAAQQYLPMWDFRWYLAQLYEESRLDPTALNPVSGAMGMPQFMPATWVDECHALGFPSAASPYDPKYAIPAGAHYMSLMRNRWTAPRSEDDRRKLAQASYDAGFENILAAQRRAKGASGYALIIARLPEVTGVHNASETTDYVRKIAQWFEQLKAEASA